MTFLMWKAVNPYPDIPRGAPLLGAPAGPPPEPLARLPTHTQAARSGTTLDLGHLICFPSRVCGEVGVRTGVGVAAGFSSGGSERRRKEVSQRHGEGCGYHRMLCRPREKKKIEK